MSSEISPAEKKRLLRERRQAKFKSGSANARINRIASSNSSFAGNKEPITAEPPKSNSQPNPRSNRISSILDPDSVNTSFSKTAASSTISEEETETKLSPQEQALSQLLGEKTSSSGFPESSNLAGEAGSQNPQDILAQMLGGTNGQENPFMNGQSPFDASQTDMFNKIFSGEGVPSMGGFSNDPNLLYNEYRLNRVKAFYQLFRTCAVTLVSLYGFFHLDIRLGVPGQSGTVASSFNVNGPILFKYFLSIEAIFVAGFLAFVQLLNGNWFQYDSIIPKSILGMVQMFIPSRVMGIIENLNKVYQVVSNIGFDVAVLTFVLAVLSIIY